MHKKIPDQFYNEFTLNETIDVYSWLFDDSCKSNAPVWPDELLSDYISRFSFDNIKNNKQGNESYGGAALFHVNAIEKYANHVKGKSIAVIGSQIPWIEAILVNAGAKEVVTVEYNVPQCKHPVIAAISYEDFLKSDKKYDSIFSYSSIEHSGLGRYGDPINPNGDIEAMDVIFKNLKDEGLCFLGIPVGIDSIVWNAHRIYGVQRLKLLFDKFIEMEWIGIDKSYLDTCEKSMNGPQPLIILKKEC